VAEGRRDYVTGDGDVSLNVVSATVRQNRGKSALVFCCSGFVVLFLLFWFSGLSVGLITESIATVSTTPNTTKAYF
jgi:hypothetical protein